MTEADYSYGEERRGMTHRGSLRTTVDVPAPAEVVWAAATDWPEQGQWIVGTEVWVTQGDGQSVGSRLAAFTGIGGVGFLDHMEIVRWEPPRRCLVRHDGRLLRGAGDFLVEPRGAEMARLTWVEDFELPLGVLGIAGWRVVRPLVLTGLRRSLQRFVPFCEGYRVA